MSLNRYSILVTGVLIATLAVAWPVALDRLSPASRWAVVVGAAIAALNTVAAYALMLWSLGRSTVAFMGAVLGGMAARMLLMLATFLAGVLLLGLPRLPLTFSLLSYFALFLALELGITHRHARTLAGAAR